jgi:predicted transcriptional regulator of viral defense system
MVASFHWMIRIGYRTRLFDITFNLQKPVTIEEIARIAGLNECYVREWLGCMEVGGIIQHNSLSGKYLLPRKHAAVLTRATGIDNLAVFFQYISLMGIME